MGFKGWPAEAFEFYEGLEADNTKAYWQDHLDLYEGSVKQPMLELLAELADEFGPGKMFRPYRDVRFSRDKSPYKTAVAAMVGPSGYVQLTAEGLAVGAGMYMMVSDQLERYRAAVDDARSGSELEAVAATLRQAGHECGAHDALRTAPRGYAKDHPRIELLRARGVTSWHQWTPAAWMGTKKAKDRIVDVLRASAPLVDWLAKHVGDARA